ncbi:MAG: hypothetical protein ACM3SV_11050 [Betaproteobacteria bacterium]
MNQIFNAKSILAGAALVATSAAFGATPGFGPKATVVCDFPAANVPQKVKPGKKGVSDGTLRIMAEKMTFKICDGCTWQKDTVKWKVTPTQYLVKTPGGVEITISRADGSALFAVTSKEDEFYLPAHAESRGQCKAADETSAKP